MEVDPRSRTDAAALASDDMRMEMAEGLISAAGEDFIQIFL